MLQDIHDRVAAVSTGPPRNGSDGREGEGFSADKTRPEPAAVPRRHCASSFRQVTAAPASETGEASGYSLAAVDDRAQPGQVAQTGTSGPACSFRVPQRSAQCLRADSSCIETSQRKWSGKYLWYGEAFLQAQTKMRFKPQSRSQSSDARLSWELGRFCSKYFQFRGASDKTAPPNVIIIVIHSGRHPGLNACFIINIRGEQRAQPSLIW